MTKLRRKFVVKILDLRRFAVFRGAVCPGECHNGEFRTRASNVKVHIKSSTYSCIWMLITLWAKGELKNHFGERAKPCLLSAGICDDSLDRLPWLSIWTKIGLVDVSLREPGENQSLVVRRF